MITGWSVEQLKQKEAVIKLTEPNFVFKYCVFILLISELLGLRRAPTRTR